MSARPGEGTPASPAEAAKASMAIARSADAASYERPERARTSHACEPCRERKTKCDGERPSCRRCLHTGNPCHYGFGKGWRKRKTQEDLSSTSQRLARYEALLTEIMPMVDARVQGLIDQARRESEAIAHSDSPESEVSSTTGISMPDPSTNIFQQGRLPALPALASPFDTGRPVASATGGPHRLQRLSSDEQALERLPSITSSGILVDRERIAALQHYTAESSGGLGPSLSPTRSMEAARDETSAP